MKNQSELSITDATSAGFAGTAAHQCQNNFSSETKEASMAAASLPRGL
jgi:hypothetical protein